MSTLDVTPAARAGISPTLPWPAPAAGTVALSVDGSFQKAGGSAAACMVLRDSEGAILFAAYRFIFHCNDLPEAELHALMQGMALTIQHSVLPLVVQSAYGHLVLEIKDLLGTKEFFPLKISRS